MWPNKGQATLKLNYSFSLTWNLEQLWQGLQEVTQWWCGYGHHKWRYLEKALNWRCHEDCRNKVHPIIIIIIIFRVRIFAFLGNSPFWYLLFWALWWGERGCETCWVPLGFCWESWPATLWTCKQIAGPLWIIVLQNREPG